MMRLSLLCLLPGVAFAQSDVPVMTQHTYYPTLLGLSCLVLIVVFCVVFYSILKHRSSPEYRSSPFCKSVGVEVFWTIIPFLLVIAMLIPALLNVF